MFLDGGSFISVFGHYIIENIFGTQLLSFCTHGIQPQSGSQFVIVECNINIINTFFVQIIRLHYRILPLIITLIITLYHNKIILHLVTLKNHLPIIHSVNFRFPSSLSNQNQLSHIKIIFRLVNSNSSFPFIYFILLQRLLFSMSSNKLNIINLLL